MLTSKSMGIALWMTCAVAVFVAIRNVRFGRPVGWIVELFTVVISALLLGGLTTALDFGGWKELDWRAALFVLLGCFAMTGVLRLCLSPRLRDSA
jgi:hypothetical protein